MKKSFLFILTAAVIGLFTACETRNAPSGGGGGGGGSDTDTVPEPAFVDLGLPSGTLWKNINEVNKNDSSGLFTFDEALVMFGNQLPSEELCRELMEECTWEWTDKGCVITGPNQKSITLPADGCVDKDDKEDNKGKGKQGYYWTAEALNPDNAGCMVFENKDPVDISIDWTAKSVRAAVRLVQKGMVVPHPGGTKTVSEIMAIYNSLGLAEGETSSDTYTVRGYVTQWNSGYPDFPNADFWIDDIATGSTSLLKCFRLIGFYDTDRRALNVGDYIEAQNCYLMNYNGTPELKDGTFTVITAAQPGSTLGSDISDFLGTYSVRAYNADHGEYQTWNDVEIGLFSNNTHTDWIYVSGINGGYDYAIGEYDAAHKAIKLYSNYTFTAATFKIEGKLDTLFISYFYPIYFDKNDANTFHLIEDGAGYEGRGEAWLTFNNYEQLVLGPAATPDKYGYYANGMNFQTYYDETGAFYGWENAYLEITFTKTANAAPERKAKAARATKATGATTNKDYYYEKYSLYHQPGIRK